MKLLTSLVAGLTIVMGSSALAAPLLTPAQLDTVRTDANVRIIDIRPTKEYGAGHIPGAVSAPYTQWRGPAESPGQLPPIKELAALIQDLGVRNDTHAVVVSSGANATDFGSSARVYWTLKYLGLTNLSVLNGGVNAWIEAGLPQDQAAPAIEKTSFTPMLNEHIIATQDYVATHFDQSTTRLVDARPHSFFKGKSKAPTAKMPGTIKNAVNLEHDKWFKPGTAIFVSEAEAKKIATESLTQPAEETISFCNTGHWAATDWFALSEVVGQPNVKLYPASLAEWTQASSPLPMDNVPGRGSQLMNKFKSLIGNS